nr:putative ribonuclease H-like domain-containing protein [Tanacetum cinerariifolium]
RLLSATITLYLKVEDPIFKEHQVVSELEFGDSYEAPKDGAATGTTSDGKKGRTVAVTTEDMQQRMNDVKARTTLLLSLPEEHQLRFNKYKTTQELWAAILKKFSGNEATRKMKKNLLKQQYGNFKAEGKETLEQTFNRFDLDTMSLDDLYNHLKVYESEVQKKSDSQNMAFISSSKNSSGNEEVNTASVPTASPQVSPAEDWEEDLHTRECRAPRSQEMGRRDNYRQGSKVEEQAPKALMAIDGVGWDWSYMANEEDNHALVVDEEAPTEFALMAKSSTDNKVEARLAEFKNQEIKFCKKIRGLEFSVECKANRIKNLTNELETLKKEKEGLDRKLSCFKLATKDLDNLIGSQRPDKIKEGLGYHNTITDYTRPNSSVESNSNDLQNSSSFASENGESTGSILSKPEIKFVKPADSPTVAKTNKKETVRKPTIKYAEFYRKTSKWSNDSGCSRYMTGNISYLSDYEPFDGGYVSFSQGGCKITGKGTIKIGKLEFENVYFVKDLKYNLFSVSQICDNKNSILFTDLECIVLGQNFKLSDDTNVLLRTPRQHNMYLIDLNNVVPHKDLTCLVAKASTDECMLWHRRLGHLNIKTMNRLVRHNLVRGLPSKCFDNDHSCVACLKGKQHKAYCKTKLVNSVTKPLHTLYMDLFGPTSVSSLNHTWYCLVVTDDFSRFTWNFFLKTKDETSGILRNFITEIENMKGLKVKIIRCDNRGEFRNKEMNDFCSRKGIKREFSNARTPQQNGVAKRRNRTLIEAAKTMLADAKLPVTFWAEAVNTACYVQNRVLVNKSQNKTPYELFNGRTPAIGFLKPFGCHVMILNTLDNLGKFDVKGDEGYFIWYSMSSKAFRVFNKRTKRVEENLHVDFLENKAIEKGAGPNWLFDIDSLTNSMNYVPVMVVGINSTNFSGTKEAAGQDVKKDVSSLRYIALPNWFHEAHLESSTSNAQDTCNADAPESSGNFNPTVTSTNPPTDHMETLAVETLIPTVSSPVPTACLNDSPKPSSDTRLISKRVTNQDDTPSLDNILTLTNRIEYILGVTTNTDDSNRVEADLGNMENNISNVWSLVDCPKEVRPIGIKWDLKNKKDKIGIVIRNKARLVAQGHTQEEGIDYDEVFTPVARIKAIRLFLAYASFMGFMVYQMDVKSAFLYGTIDEEVYVMQPLGFQDPEFPTKVYKVEKAMYGLHQAPRA